MIKKITSPTTRLPRVTKLPKVSMMAPALACARIRRVVEMVIARRNVVAIRMTAGSAENSSGRFR